MPINETDLPPHLLEDLLQTKPFEIQCDAAGLMMDRSVAANLSETESRQRFPELWQHLALCPDCTEEYDLLLMLTDLEERGELQQPDQLPPVPDKAAVSLSSFIKEVIEKVFPGFPRGVALAVQRGEDALDAEPAMIALDEQYTLQIDVAPDEESPTLRLIFCTLLTEEASALEASEGASAWLQEAGGAVIQEVTVDGLGDFTFEQIKPGDYYLRLYLTKREIIISTIKVP